MILLPEADWDVDSIAAWLATMTDPLVEPEVVVETQKRARSACGRDPARASTWFAGVGADMVASLPGPDPWRSLSARVVNPGGSDVVVEGAAPVPGHTGAESGGGRFGSWHDGTDLVPPAHRDVAADPGLAALATGLSDEAAAVLACCSSSWQEARHGLLLVSGERGERVFDTGAAVVRWLTWRRRVYAGADDLHLVTTGMMWLEMLDGAAGQDEVDQQARDENDAGGLLDDGLYRAHF